MRHVIDDAGSGAEPLVVVIEAAEQLLDEELAVVLSAAEHSGRDVILRVVEPGFGLSRARLLAIPRPAHAVRAAAYHPA